VPLISFRRDARCRVRLASQFGQASADDTAVVPPGVTRFFSEGCALSRAINSLCALSALDFLSEGRALSRPAGVAVRLGFGGRHGGRPSGCHSIFFRRDARCRVRLASQFGQASADDTEVVPPGVTRFFSEGRALSRAINSLCALSAHGLHASL
jgi:hypothetical protein